MGWRRTTNKEEAPLPSEQDLTGLVLEWNYRLFRDFPADGIFTREKLLWVDSAAVVEETPAVRPVRRGGLWAALLRFIKRLLHWK